MFRASSIHFQEALKYQFLVLVARTVAVGWLKVVDQLVYWAWGVGVSSVAW
jgi:hypothetical protein